MLSTRQSQYHHFTINPTKYWEVNEVNNGNNTEPNSRRLLGEYIIASLPTVTPYRS